MLSEERVIYNKIKSVVRKNLFIMKIIWETIRPNEFDELIAFSLLNSWMTVWGGVRTADSLHGFIFRMTEVYL